MVFSRDDVTLVICCCIRLFIGRQWIYMTTVTTTATTTVATTTTTWGEIAIFVRSDFVVLNWSKHALIIVAKSSRVFDKKIHVDCVDVWLWRPSGAFIWLISRKTALNHHVRHRNARRSSAFNRSFRESGSLSCRLVKNTASTSSYGLLAKSSPFQLHFQPKMNQNEKKHNEFN